MSDNIKVVVKVRPLISREIEDKLSYQWRAKNNTLYQLDSNGKDVGQCFTFDKVYDKDTKTQDVYNDIAKPIVEAAVAGFNGTIFAYGQTSSGKTFTMAGTEESPGIIPLAVLNLFEIIKTIPDRDFLVRVSYIEIYNEQLKDLLDAKKKIKIHEGLQGVKVDATERVTSSPEEVLEVMREGEVNRQTGATNMNEESSRSHSIFQITIESREHVEGEEECGCVNVSELNLVDLAGSERAGQTGATGIRFKEGTHINKSLSVLALVIKQLSEDPNKYANYRDSKLTRILQNSLGGNAKTSIICAITPASVEETISTLQFANRAKAIQNKPAVNAVVTNATMIQGLTKQLSKLQSQLEGKKNVEQDNVNLQKQIANLQKLILNGFGQRSSLEMMASSRRKVAAPSRRITISTLHPIQEDALPAIPKFCTPSLKYNPLAMSTESLPAQRLPSLPEDTPRSITPPPKNKKVDFDTEIIEIDSDDDASSEPQTCSPYHKCYGSSKTPPCVLRNNAKKAEQCLKDIVELTEREKMYAPSVVELIEKLEQKTNAITKLNEEINGLHENRKEKDLEVDQLKIKINETEDQVKNLVSAKEELESTCKDYNIKLTDWEVTYDTLKKKSKLREEELLSLLEEQKGKSSEPIGKPLSRTIDKDPINFMDMSKDISLVNSDNESSIANANDDDSPQLQQLVIDIQAELTSKNQTILELESNLSAQTERIESLENASQKLQVTIAEFKNKFCQIENENSYLKSTIETLNSTIDSQKVNLETAKTDIVSYISTIQELQIKLTNKDNLLRTDINDSMLETMVANQEQFIANNENMKNIIHCFKVALDTRNKEINSLKSSIQDTAEFHSDRISLKDEIDTKEHQLVTLNAEVEKLKAQINENIDMTEKLQASEQELHLKLAEVHKENVILQQNIKDSFANIATLKEDNDKLTQAVIEKENNEHTIVSQNTVFANQIQDMSQKIDKLEHDITLKDKEISSCRLEEKELEKHSSKAKFIVTKIKHIMFILTGNTQGVPEMCSDLEIILNTAENILTDLEHTAIKVVEDKHQATDEILYLRKEIVSSLENHRMELENLQSEIETLGRERSEIILQNEEMSNQIMTLMQELDDSNDKQDKKYQDVSDLESKLRNAEETNKNLLNDLLSKDSIITLLQKRVASFCDNIDTLSNRAEQDHNELKLKLDNLNSVVKNKEDSFNRVLKDKDTVIEDSDHKLKDLKMMLEQKCSQVATLNQKIEEALGNKDQVLDIILTRATNITNEFDIENNLSSNSSDSNVNIYDKILLTLDKIANHIVILQSEARYGNEDVNKILSETKSQVDKLTQQNYNLMEELSEIELRNHKLISEMESMDSVNKTLFGTSELLEQLKMDLQMKSEEIDTMNNKAKELRDHFVQFKRLMDQQMEELVTENEKLKSRDLESEVESKLHTCPDSNTRKTVPNLIEIQRKTPQSLLTICCNKIVDAMEPSDNDYKSVTTSSSKISVVYQNTETQTDICECIKLSSELHSANDLNNELLEEVKHLKSVNESLVREQEEIRGEIQLLMAPANELQKKIANHRTNLATLTATTYAENKLLHSQLKVLKHHYTRYIHVCQRDIPVFKTQLNELMATLKGSPSVIDKHNASFKRYSLPDVLDTNTTISNFKNESTLDGDLLMLDTNFTLTSVDNSFVDHDQTCLDVTQVNFDSEVACQTNDLSKTLDPCLVYTQLEILTSDNQKLFEKFEALTEENHKLREQLNKFDINKSSSVAKVDAQSSPIKVNGSVSESTSTDDPKVCTNFDYEEKLLQLQNEVQTLSQELVNVKARKDDIEKENSNLKLEMPITDSLVRKLSILENQYDCKKQELSKLTNDLNKKNKLIKELQEENDSLSTQIMENISEADNLKIELDALKEINSKLGNNESEKLGDVSKIFSKVNNSGHCSECILKDELISTLQNKTIEVHTKLNRTLSDSESSSRLNKICTLQNELHASKEDCKKITEEVATIKNHLERSNLSITQSMDLDESMGDSNIFAFSKNFDTAETHLNRFNMPKVSDDSNDGFTLDKTDCINYLVEKAGIEKENLDGDVKMIDIMKMLYDALVTKHGNEVENLVNKMRDFEDSRNQLKSQIDIMTIEYSKVTKELEMKENSVKSFTNVLSDIRNNINIISKDITNSSDTDRQTKLVTMFKDNLLQLFDNELNLSCVGVFETLIDTIFNNHQKYIDAVTKRYTELQQHTEGVVKELDAVNDNFKQMKIHLSEKESEYNLLKAQKERIHEISNAVTLDMIKKEQDLKEFITKAFGRLIELNVMTSSDVELQSPLNNNLDVIIERLIEKIKDQDKSELEKEIAHLTTQISESVSTIDELKHELLDKEKQLQAHVEQHENLNKAIADKADENLSNRKIIEKLTRDIDDLKQVVLDKDSAIKCLLTGVNSREKEDSSAKDATIAQLTQRIQDLIRENDDLKSVNQTISKEKEAYALELDKLGETIKQNKHELERMTSDILVLRETVRDNVSVIESLTLEAKSLMQQNEEVKKQFQEKCIDCSRLEVNIKTHEKTAEIQSKIITRLQKQKEEDDKAVTDKYKQLEDLTQKCTSLQKERDDMKEHVDTLKQEIEGLNKIKNTLETRVSELESETDRGPKGRPSMEALEENARRRRQSLHDCRRVVIEELHNQDHHKIEDMFGSRSRPDDLFMDVDDDDSNRSTPLRLSKGRDSFHSRTESDKDEESRPSSVLATRRRRQSLHDLHRSTLGHTPSPSGDHVSTKLIERLNNLEQRTSRSSQDSEVCRLKESLAACQRELDDMREKYRELDDECETCAQYLREREERCERLKEEKALLENRCAELMDKLKSNRDPGSSRSRPSYAHASVNTDKDWANLHAVVVDRMSFDAEVEKNKALRKSIEELRYTKQQLKTELAKMQVALEKHTSYKENRELEVTRSELKACKKELAELKQQYNELDEECEMCAQYLREREEQCCRLKKEKAELEAKLKEFQEDASAIAAAVRKKRQSAHDLNRTPVGNHSDAATETEDFLTYQVERDSGPLKEDNSRTREPQHKMGQEKHGRDKACVEHSASQPTVYVSTGSGIVQNQQLSDVMKENQKLKKINAKLVEICKKRGKSLATIEGGANPQN